MVCRPKLTGRKRMDSSTISIRRRDVESAKLPRFALSLSALLLIGAPACEPAHAAFPERIIKIIVPQAPGGGTDAIARVLAQEMARDLGGSVIVENKAGAGTIVGTQGGVKSEPAGHPLLMGTFASAVNSSLVAKLPYDVHRDLAPVALVARAFNIVVVNPKSPLKSVADLIAAAKAEPGKLSYGTYGTGTSAHLGGELFKSLAGVDMTAVPYKGWAPGIPDLLGDPIRGMFATVSSAAALIEAGQLRALAVTSAERSPAFPQLPTVAEAGVPGYVLENWYSLFAPAKTPPEIVDRLKPAASKALQSEAFRKIAANEGLIMVPAPPEEFARYFRGEEERWPKVIQDPGIKVERGVR